MFVRVDAEFAQTQASQFRAQALLGDLTRVVCALGAQLEDAESAWSHGASTPVPEFGHHSTTQKRSLRLSKNSLLVRSHQLLRA